MSVRVLLQVAWAAAQDLEIFQFDCKTAFLHAKLHHDLYARPFPGFDTSDSSKVLRILVALYGLRQAAYEFYMLLMSLLLGLGMIRCDVDHGVFIGEWDSPPDPSIPMPTSGPLVLYVPLHVDDGLGITNSPSLYAWFLRVLSQRLHIVDLGPCSKFLSILIIRDRPSRKIWLSSHVYVSELLDEWHLSSCKPASTPFPPGVSSSSPAPPGSLPDADLVPLYQRLVGCLLYFAITTHPDLSYYAMWLGLANLMPHLLVRIFSLPNTFFATWLGRNSLRSALDHPLLVSHLHWAVTCRMLAVPMLTGPPTRLIGRVSPATCFISKVPSFLGLLLSKNLLLYHRRRQNTTL